MNRAVSLDTAQLEADMEFIETEALKLPPQERARLAEILMSSLDPIIDPVEQAGIDKAWADEAERRYQEILDGRAVTIPADEVMRRVWDRLKR